MKVSNHNLPALAANLPVPSYKREAVPPSIVHIGVGGFHRAHQAVYLDDLLQEKGIGEWGLFGVGILPQDAKIARVLRQQDYLYTVVERDAAGDRPRIIGSIGGFLHGPEQLEQTIAALAAASTRIVSLTITEGGYYVHQGTGEFDQQHPDIRHDLENPDRPRAAFGYLAAALRARREKDAGPLSIQSCDNVQENGEVLRTMLLSFLRLNDDGLANWVEQNVTFPNSMVDRITPATNNGHIELLRQNFGIEDQWPVVTEPFRQWIIEDQFAAGRPNWERVGAQITSDVLPYEKMKIRLLNASHQALCYIGMLLGYSYAHQTMEDKHIRRLVQNMMDVEVTPLLPQVPGVDLEQYKRTLIARFANPSIEDQLARIGTEGSARIPKFVLPSVVEGLEHGTPIRYLSFTVAAWIRYLAGTDDSSRPLPISDPLEAELRQALAEAGADGILGMRKLFGDALPRAPRFADEVRGVLKDFQTKGAAATLRDFLES